MSSPEIPNTPAQSNIDKLSETEKKDIHYFPDLNFRNVDGNFNILNVSDRTLTNEDIARGIVSQQEKINFSFSNLLNGLSLQLYDQSRVMSDQRKAEVESLIKGKSIFIPLDGEKIDQTFVAATKLFPDSQPGVMLVPETGEVINQISAIKYKDGHIARLLQAAKNHDLRSYVDQLNHITPYSETRSLNDSLDVYAIEFVSDGERPTLISSQELDDWLTRVRRSGLIFSFDVDYKNGEGGLDNFIRKDGKLMWIDGNIVNAKKAQSAKELDTFIAEQRDILVTYLKDKTTK